MLTVQMKSELLKYVSKGQVDCLQLIDKESQLIITPAQSAIT